MRWLQVLLCAMVLAGPFSTKALQASGDEVDLKSLPVQTDREIAAQRAIESLLDRPIALTPGMAPLVDALDKFSVALGVPIWIDHKALDEAGISQDQEIEFGIPGVSGRTVLETILRQVDLTWTFRGDIIEVTTPDVASTRTVVRVYPVKDLIGVEYEDGSVIYDFESLIELITSEVAPQSWDEVGGQGSVSSFRSSGCLVFSQTREVHRMVERLFTQLRAVRKAQGIVAVKRKGSPKIVVGGMGLGMGMYNREPERAADRLTVSTQPPAWRVPQVYK